MFGLDLPSGAVLFIAIITIIYAIFMFFLPFFIFSIRNQTIQTNKLLREIAELLGSQDPEVIDISVKRCPHCGAKNKKEDIICSNCCREMKWPSPS